MDIRDIKKIATAEEAEEYAKDWQVWQADEAMSYRELVDWQEAFTELAERFNLTEVFEENGII
jgi:hypothetical protein